MKNEQQQQAKHLYFQSALNKSQIAELLGVNRRTVMLWVQQGNWDRLKLSAQHLPAMVVEKCYYVLDHYLTNLLSANGTISTFGPKEASAINQLATAIKKVRTRSAVNESMEMMSFFLDEVRRKDPTMAIAITPFIEQYIASRKEINLSDFLPANFNDQGLVNDTPEDIMEQWLDQQEYAKMDRELAEQEAGVMVSSSNHACHGDPVTVPQVPTTSGPQVPTTSGSPSNHSSSNCESALAEPTRDIRAEYEAWKIKKAELEEVLRECFGEPLEPQIAKAAGEPVTEPAIASSPIENTSSRPATHKPYMPSNPMANIFRQRETLPKSVEKQLTEYLRNQNKTAA